MSRATAPLLSLSAAALAAAGGYSWWATPGTAQGRSGFVVPEPDRDVGAVAVGSSHEVAYRIVNTGPRPIRLIGTSGGGCRGNYCFGPKPGADTADRTVAIPPGGSLDVLYELDVRRPGPIGWGVTLFVEDDGVHDVPVSVRGRSVPKGENDAPQHH